MSPPFPDHFAPVAGAYAARRPRYPDALFAYLATLPARRELAWDCGAGSGQASVPLARHFGRVLATDASRAQLAAAAALALLLIGLLLTSLLGERGVGGVLRG